MEKQIQKPGVRKWYADDFLKLQDQLYLAIEAGILGDVGNVIISGVTTTDNGNNFDISAGYCLIDGKLIPFEGILSQDLPAYLFLDCSETTNKEYADGVSKPTELKCIARITETQPSGEYIKIIDEENTLQRLLLPKYDSNGNLRGIPKTDSLDLSQTNILATAKAINNLYALTMRKYFKENFDSGEINLGSIPAGHSWLGKNGSVKIDDAGQMSLEALDVNAEVIADTVEADLIYSTDEIQAVGNITTAGKFAGDNAPKILLHIESDGAGLLSSKGSVELGSADVLDGGTGLCTIDVVVPADAILMVSVQAPAYHGRISRHPTNGKPNIETYDSNNNYVNAETHVSIYY